METSTPTTSDVTSDAQKKGAEVAAERHDGYQWTALSVTTVGALLASIQGSALLIALPNILTELHATFFTIMWVLIGFLVGPIIGGLLTEWSWRWVFLFNVPFAIFGALWGIWRLREPVRLARHQHIDWFGSAALTIGLTGVLLALSLFAFPMFGQTANMVILAVGVLSLVLFGLIEPRIKEPIVQLRLFRDRLFALANLSGLLNAVARFCSC